MLSVSVELSDVVVVALDRELITGLERAAVADVERMAGDDGSGIERARLGVVTRAVVDDEHIGLRVFAVDFLDDSNNPWSLVERGYDHEKPAARLRRDAFRSFVGCYTR